MRLPCLDPVLKCFAVFSVSNKIEKYLRTSPYWKFEKANSSPLFRELSTRVNWNMKYIFMLLVVHLESAIVTGCCSVKTVREPEILSPLLARKAKVLEPWFEPEQWNNKTCTDEEKPRVRLHKGELQPESCNTDCDCVPCAPYCSKWWPIMTKSDPYFLIFASGTGIARLPGGRAREHGSSQNGSAWDSEVERPKAKFKVSIKSKAEFKKSSISDASFPLIRSP